MRGWFLIAALCAAAGVATSAESRSRGATQAGASPGIVLPAYADSSGDLNKLTQDILRAAKDKQKQKFDAYVESLVVPAGSGWFRETFGDKTGAELAAAYHKRRRLVHLAMAETFNSALKRRQDQVTVIRFEKACDPAANDEQYPILAARQKGQSLYEIRLGDGRKWQSVWFVAHLEGGFRYLGKLSLDILIGSPDSVPTAENKEPPRRIRIGGTVQQARLIKHVRPEYPREALDAHLQGTVRLLAIIGSDGALSHIRVIRGHCWLAEAAVKAVSQWQYSPTLFEGVPVEVVTTIDMVFSLSAR